MIDLFMSLCLISLLGLLIGTIKPAVVLKWDSKPSRIKSVIYGLISFLSFGIAATSLMDSNYHYSEGMAYYEQSDFDRARNHLIKVDSTFAQFEEVNEKIATIDSLLLVSKLTDPSTEFHDSTALVAALTIMEKLDSPDFVETVLLSLSEHDVVNLRKGMLQKCFSSNHIADSLFHLTLLDNLDQRKILIEQVKNQSIKEKVEGQFGWRGRHMKLTYYIKENMHDPNSFDHVETTYSIKENYMLVQMKFRGTNMYGAKVLHQAIARTAIEDGSIIELMELQML